MENKDDNLPQSPSGEASPGAASGDRLEQLLEGVLFASLSPQEWDELSKLVESDDHALRRYVETTHLRESLYDYGCSQPPSAGAPHTEWAAEDPRAMGARSESARSSAPATHRTQQDHDSTWNRWFPLSLATAIALMIGAGAGYLVSQDRQGRQTAAINTGPTMEGLLPGIPANGEPARRGRLGSITGLSPEASADGLLRSMQVGEELRRGEVIQLTRGVMRVSFTAGPEALIEGPAEFSVVADRAMFVHRGRVKTTSKGKFSVQTPLVNVESTDAELAVVADGTKPSTVFALAGNAELHSNPHRNVRYELLEKLASGEGVSVALENPAARLEVAPAKKAPDLVASWDEVTDKLHAYEQLVLSDEPLAYWPLYRVRRNRRVLDLTQNGFDGQAIGNWPSELSDASSTQVRGAYFAGESYIEPDFKPPVNFTTGFTIEGWAKVTGEKEFQSVFTSRWVFASNTPNQQCFGFTLYAGDDDCWQFWSGSGEYGAGWQTLITPVMVDRARWTHVAATFTPQRVEQGQSVEGVVTVYVNGEKVGEDTHRLSLIDFEWPARIGAAEFVPKSLTSWLFRGELRDIALYDYPVAVERLKEHTRLGIKAT